MPEIGDFGASWFALDPLGSGAQAPANHGWMKLRRGEYGCSVGGLQALEQIPPKPPDFGDKDLLQHIDLARILFGEVIPLRRDAR
jgi:hypothetical protein